MQKIFFTCVCVCVCLSSSLQFFTDVMLTMDKLVYYWQFLGVGNFSPGMALSHIIWESHLKVSLQRVTLRLQDITALGGEWSLIRQILARYQLISLVMVEMSSRPRGSCCYCAVVKTPGLPLCHFASRCVFPERCLTLWLWQREKGRVLWTLRMWGIC